MASEDERMNVYGVTACSVGVCLIALTLVNVYIGSRENDSVRRGYLIGYAESKAGFPSRYPYYEPENKKENVNAAKGN